MSFDEYVKLGLSDKYPLKVIMRGYVHQLPEEKVGVTEVIFVTTDTALAKKKFKQYSKDKDKTAYWMVYAVPYDVDLRELDHYPSIAMTMDDLK